MESQMNNKLKIFMVENNLNQLRVSKLTGVPIETVRNWFRTKGNDAPPLVLKHLKLLKSVGDL